MTWCTVWKGTSQDCIDHMRRAHNIPALVKAANLARCFLLGQCLENNGLVVCGRLFPA